MTDDVLPAASVSVRTARLRLERLTLDEARAVTALDRTGRAWAADYPSEGDLVVAGIACEAGEHHDEVGVFGVYQVRLLSTGLAVGGVGFIHPPCDGEVEVGYGLVGSAQGHGYATEAVRAVMRLAAEQGVVRMVAMTAVDNLASQQVLRRCGFTVGPETVVDEDDGPMLRWERAITAPRPAAPA